MIPKKDKRRLWAAEMCSPVTSGDWMDFGMNLFSSIIAMFLGVTGFLVRHRWTVASVALALVVGHYWHPAYGVAMSAKPPRRKTVGTLNYTANQTDTLLGENKFPAYLYEDLYLRLSGSHQKVGTVNPTLVPENPLTCVNFIRNTIGDTDFIKAPLTDLAVLSSYIFRRPGRVPSNLVPSTADRNSTDSFSADIWLPYIQPDMIDARRGIFPSNRYTNVSLNVDWADHNAMVTGGTLTTNQLNTTKIDVVAQEWTGEKAYENATNYQLHKRVSFLYNTNGQALVDQLIEIPRDPSQLRGVLVKFIVPSPETPQPIGTGALSTDKVSLLFNKNDHKIDHTWGALQTQNTDDYGIQLPDGYYFFDLAPDGDRARLQDTTSGVYELQVNCQAVGSQQLRILPVRYGVAK